MTRIVWDEIGERIFETGTKHGVLYPQENGKYPKGVVWNGLTAVTESPTGAESTPLWAGDNKYLSLTSAEEFAATIEAYMYPAEFAECDGSAEIVPGVSIGQQARKPFGFCYQTTIGNDTEGTKFGYYLHLIYGAKAAPSERNYQTINDQPDALKFSWAITTTPVAVEGHDPTATITIDSRTVDPKKLKELEDILYGKDATSESASDGLEPRLPLPAEVFELLKKEA